MRITWYCYIYLLTAIGLSPGGSTHLHTNNTRNNTNNNRTRQITTNVEECWPCPVFAGFTLAFALQLRKKTEKPQSVLRIQVNHLTVAAVPSDNHFIDPLPYITPVEGRHEITLPPTKNATGSYSFETQLDKTPKDIRKFQWQPSRLQCRPKHLHFSAASLTEDNCPHTATSNVRLTDFHWLLNLERKGGRISKFENFCQ
jgi:hypothetical protein